jgi:hypothetical protein
MPMLLPSIACGWMVFADVHGVSAYLDSQFFGALQLTPVR